MNSDAVYKKIAGSNLRKAELNYDISGISFGIDTLKWIINFINYVHTKYKGASIPIKFNLKNVSLTDKCSYALFECICESLIKNHKHIISINYSIERDIITEGIKFSPLLILGRQKNVKQNISDFLDKFKFDINKTHFRRLIEYEKYKQGNQLSGLLDEITWFQNSFDINYECRDEIAEVIVELVGNAIEHSMSDCLLDFDIATDYVKKNGESVCGINIAVINFSDIILGDMLKKKIVEQNINFEPNSKYRFVLQAFENHKKFFDDVYNEKDFFTLSSFQHKISGRMDNSITGGTGLTKLIQTIEERADSHSCYVITGDKKITFEPEYLEYKDGWFGFNKENDFLNFGPDVGIIDKNSFYMPGTAYNLNFVMKVNKDGKKD